VSKTRLAHCQRKKAIVDGKKLPGPRRSIGLLLVTLPAMQGQEQFGFLACRAQPSAMLTDRHSAVHFKGARRPRGDFLPTFSGARCANHVMGAGFTWETRTGQDDIPRLKRPGQFAVELMSDRALPWWCWMN